MGLHVMENVLNNIYINMSIIEIYLELHTQIYVNKKSISHGRPFSFFFSSVSFIDCEQISGSR